MVYETSFFDNEQKCIKALLDLHNSGEPIDCDPMYNKGHFYSTGLIYRPLLRYDINAEKNGYDAKQEDATNLPLKNNSINSIILDPPFCFGIHNKKPNSFDKKISARYTMFKDFEELEQCYKGIISEAYRILKKKGILIFKCQDYTDMKTTMTHCLVYNWATETGFYAKDLAILNLPKNKMYNGNIKQKHLRKTHCYFWVFIKK